MFKKMKNQLLPDLRDLLNRTAGDFLNQPDPTLLPPAEGRALFEKNNQRWNVNLPDMQYAEEIIIATPSQSKPSQVHTLILQPQFKKSGTIIFVHGGGFCFGSSKSHERCARVLAETSGMTVMLPNYRLAPENPFPAGLNDIITVIESVTDGKVIDLEGPVFVAGDSAGANIALAAMLDAIDHDRVLPQGALLFYGNYAMNFETASYQAFADGPGLTRDRMKRYWHWYSMRDDISNEPLACPLIVSDEKLKKLPPLYLMAAGVDPLLSDTLSLHARLCRLERDDPLHVVDGVTHGFLQYTNELSAAVQALEDAATALETMIN